MEQKTALIPTWFGLVLLVFGLLGFKEGLRKHVMHVAAALGLIGVLATFRGLLMGFALVFGAEIERPVPAVVTQSLMAIGCIAFLALCIRSFIQARRQRAVSGE